MESNDSPEIPDWKETSEYSDISGLLSGKKSQRVNQNESFTCELVNFESPRCDPICCSGRSVTGVWANEDTF